MVAAQCQNNVLTLHSTTTYTLVYGLVPHHYNERQCDVNVEVEFELEEWQDRVDALRIANEHLRDERNRLKDAADSLHIELEACRVALKQANSVISRLRNHIAQGIEL